MLVPPPMVDEAVAKNPPVNVEAVVDVAKIWEKVGVDEETIDVPLKARIMSDPREVAFVPPLATGRVPVTSVVRLTDVPRSAVRALPVTVRPVPAKSEIKSSDMFKTPDIARDVVVAFVVVEFDAVKSTKVDDPVIRRLPRVARPVVVMAEAPLSMLPNPLVIEPESRTPVVVRFDRVSMADSMVDSVVASMASISFRDAVSPPLKMLVVPKVISPPETTRSNVVVALPSMVNPVMLVPPPMVDEAVAKNPPVNVEAVVDVEVNAPAKKMSPWIDRAEPGEVVPMPKFPAFVNLALSEPAV